MQNYSTLSSQLFTEVEKDFEHFALEIFEYQYNFNPIYKQFVNYLNKKDSVKDIYSIPFLPVEFFKNHQILSSELQAKDYFESSGTTGSITSKHFFQDLEVYQKSYLLGFERVYGAPQDWIILGLLPSYLERKHASLVNMVDGLIKISNRPENGFFLYNYEELHQLLLDLNQKGQKVILFGVTFAIIEFARLFPNSLKNTIIVETGGMKGRGKELTREELHQIIHERLHPQAIHSEYGMSEMFSQAYSTDAGIFHCSPTMRVLKRNPYDPFDVSAQKGRGNINVIDLSNIHSCSFIATMDIGDFFEDGTFKVLGRSDFSDVRGCNLMFS